MVTQKSMVVHSNSITRATYRLSVVESRVILTAISQMGQDEQPSDDHYYWCSAKDLVDLGMSEKNVYSQLKVASRSLFDRHVTIQTENGSRQFRWVQEVYYDDESSRVGIRFSKPMLPFLSQVTASFTSFRLLGIRDLSSEYAIRLFAMCSQYKDTGWMQITIDELRQCLELVGKYEGMSMLRSRVLDVAVNQINHSSNSGMRLSYRLLKQGRLYTGIRFEIKGTQEVKEKVIKLTERQAFSFAKKFIENKTIFNDFYNHARKNGLDLYGLDNEQSIKRIAEWLLKPENALLAKDCLVEAGFNFSTASSKDKS